LHGQLLLAYGDDVYFGVDSVVLYEEEYGVGVDE